MAGERPERAERPKEEARRLQQRIGRQAARKRRAERERGGSVWFGLGMFGLVGWSVTIPTLAAVALGVWIDTTWRSRYSWTLMLLVPGIALGCLNAWYWVERERRGIEMDRRAAEEEQHDG